MFLDCHLMMTNPERVPGGISRRRGRLLLGARRGRRDRGAVRRDAAPRPRRGAGREPRDTLRGSGALPPSHRPAADHERPSRLRRSEVHRRRPLPKLAEAWAQAERQRSNVTLQVDGGIDESTAPVAAAAGARCLRRRFGRVSRARSRRGRRPLHALASAAVQRARDATVGPPVPGPKRRRLRARLPALQAKVCTVSDGVVAGRARGSLRRGGHRSSGGRRLRGDRAACRRGRHRVGRHRDRGVGRRLHWS